MLNGLLVSGAVVLDVVFVAVVLLGLLLGVKKGFIKGICKLAGTLFAVAFALFFCISFETFLDSAFGMRTAIANGIVESLSQKEFFQTELTGLAHDALLVLLDDAGLGNVASEVVVDAVVSQNVPEGTTLAMIVGPLFAKWISMAISVVLLFVLIKLATVILAALLTGAVEKIKVLKFFNKLFGGLLGLLKSCVLVFIVLMIASWLPIESVQTFIDGSTVVGAIYRSEWFTGATQFVVSFEWLNAFLTAQP
ncbi:MAG: CvpA family protein [Clostridia bacterium]|nr:CvpA family protein [Clostridia bacterium]